MQNSVPPRRAAAPAPDALNQFTESIIGAAIEVHRILGPGLLESIYERALAHELSLRGMSVRLQAQVSVFYKGIEIRGQRLDMVVDPGIVVELKAVERLAPIHEAQLLSYLKATRMRLGLLLNFNSIRLKDGIKRIAN